MDKESLEKIKKIFKSLNDKLAKIEDPALYGRKRTAKYNVVDRQIDNVKSNDNAVNNALNDINEKLDEHDNILEDHADKLDELQNNKNEIVPIKDDATKVEPQKDPTEEQLKAANLRYDERTERFHENEGPRKNLMVSRAEALNRVEEHKSKNATAEPSDEPSDENSILEEIHSNLIKINESLSSVLSLSTNKPPTDAEPVDSDGKQQLDGQQPKEKGGMGGLLGTIAFTLFAIFPTVLAWIKEKREKISEFLMPVFDFIFESAIPFFTEKLPKFFMEDIPEYFSEKFDVVKDFASDFIGDIKKVIAGIQKTVGETIVSLADKLPDGPFDVLKNMKKGLKDFGEGLISDADNTITEVDKEQAKTQAKREEKKKRDILLKQADDEGKRVVELNKAKGYKGYEVKPDFEKGLVKIEYKVDKILDGVSQEFDANKSMETETLVEKSGGSSRSVKGDNGGTPNKDGEGQSAAASSGGTPEPMGSSGTGETGATTSGGAGVQAEGGAIPEPNQGTADKGNTLDTNSKENENPPAKPKSSAPPVVNIPSTGQKVRMLPGQGPHDINDVPDPTPFLGDMANQLFYRSA